MTKVTQKIDPVEIIEVCPPRDPEGEYLQINLIMDAEEYETWLTQAGRLDWTMNGVDHTGAHTQVEGKMMMEEYWALDHKEHLKDLVDYFDFLKKKAGTKPF